MSERLRCNINIGFDLLTEEPAIDSRTARNHHVIRRPKSFLGWRFKVRAVVPDEYEPAEGETRIEGSFVEVGQKLGDRKDSGKGWDSSFHSHAPDARKFTWDRKSFFMATQWNSFMQK